MRIVLYLLITVAWLYTASPIFAEEVLFSDNFNDGNATDWTVQRNSQWSNPDKPCLNGGQPTSWNVVEGELGITINGGPSCTTTITPNLDLTNTQSFSFSFDWSFPESIHMDRNVALLWQDTNNWYGIKIIGTELRIEKVVAGRVWSLTNNWTNYNFEANKQYHFSLSVGANNKIVVSINGNQVLVTDDQVPFIKGFKTVGLMASTGAVRYSVSYFDNIEVKSLDDSTETNLHVPLIMQSDPSWKDDIYDKATQWSTKPTIARWGCALTSAAMILNYYGIDRMPNSTLITPYTLNAWLNGQPDGYVGEGAINWMAVTRLTYQLSSQLNTPKLEYRWQAFDKETIKNELAKKQPVIVNIPGHFLVADGYTNSNEILIRDPAYSYTKLNQHSSTPTSIRTFKPSQTDLSYIMVVHRGSEVIIRNELANNYSEYIEDEIDKAKNKEVFFATLAQPKPGEYVVEIIPKTENELITIYTYTQIGTVTMHQFSITEPSAFVVHFSLTEKSSIEKIPFSLSFRQLLQKLYQEKEVFNRYVFLQLDRLAGYAETDSANYDRYQRLIVKKIEEFSPYLSPTAQMALKEKMI